MSLYRFACQHCPPARRYLARWLSSSPAPNECPECGELVEPNQPKKETDQ